MKTVAKYMVTVCGMFIIIILGLFAPSKISKIQDEKILEKIKLENTEEIKAVYQQQFDIIETISLLQSNDLTEISITKGKNYTKQSVEKQCYEEFNQLFECLFFSDTKYGVYNGLAEILGEVKSNSKAYVYMEEKNPSNYVIIWKISYDLGEKKMEVLLDDDTGKILMFHMPVLKGKNYIAGELGLFAKYFGYYLEADCKMIDYPDDMLQEGNSQQIPYEDSFEATEKITDYNDRQEGSDADEAIATYYLGNHSMEYRIKIDQGEYYFGNWDFE